MPGERIPPEANVDKLNASLNDGLKACRSWSQITGRYSGPARTAANLSRPRRTRAKAPTKIPRERTRRKLADGVGACRAVGGPRGGMANSSKWDGPL